METELELLKNQNKSLKRENEAWGASVQNLEHQLDLIQSNPVNQQLEMRINELLEKNKSKKEKLKTKSQAASILNQDLKL